MAGSGKWIGLGYPHLMLTDIGSYVDRVIHQAGDCLDCTVWTKQLILACHYQGVMTPKLLNPLSPKRS